MSISLCWVKIFYWVSFIYSSFHFERADGGNYTAITSVLDVQNDSVVIPFPNNCACYDHEGKIYNLAGLQSTDGNPSFTAKGKKSDPGYRYSYNPCSAFKQGPLDGGCQIDVAICWWVPQGSPDTYKTIGNQDKARCHVDKETRVPVLMYNSVPHIQSRKASVKLKCDEYRKTKDEALFEVLDENLWIFRLTHLCSCGNGCPVLPEEKPTTDHFVPQNVGIPVAAAAGSTVFLLVLLLVWRLVKRRNRNNDNGENQNLVGEQYVNDYGPRPIQEGSAGMSESLRNSSSNSKPDVNIVRSSLV